jgi:hypothetical protein
MAQPKNMKETKHSNLEFEKEENQQWVSEKLIVKELFDITITFETTNIVNDQEI